MPCMSYEADYTPTDSTKSLRDKLARIACKAMTQLERVDPTNNLFKNKEAKDWWTEHKIADARAMDAKRKQAEAKALRKAALDKLTPEEKKVLGVR